MSSFAGNLGRRFRPALRLPCPMLPTPGQPSKPGCRSWACRCRRCRPSHQPANFPWRRICPARSFHPSTGARGGQVAPGQVTAVALPAAAPVPQGLLQYDPRSASAALPSSPFSLPMPEFDDALFPSFADGVPALPPLPPLRTEDDAKSALTSASPFYFLEQRRRPQRIQHGSTATWYRQNCHPDLRRRAPCEGLLPLDPQSASSCLSFFLAYAGV